MTAQEFPIRILKSHAEKNRVAASYIFTGSDTEKKMELALWFAESLNCEDPKRGRVEFGVGGQIQPGPFAFAVCACPSCGKIKRHTHPDVHWLGEDPKVRSIKIEEARLTLEKVSYKPYEGKYKVFIFVGAERLTIDASNALLKSLEEPPPHTVFLLLVENKAHLIPTIVSRSFEIRVGSRPHVISDAPRHMSRVRDNRWEDYFEALQTKPRDEVQTALTELMEECVLLRKGGATLAPPLEAADAVWQAKEALEDNANQKLALSRLAMKLRKIL